MMFAEEGATATMEELSSARRSAENGTTRSTVNGEAGRPTPDIRDDNGTLPSESENILTSDSAAIEEADSTNGGGLLFTIHGNKDEITLLEEGDKQKVRETLLEDESSIEKGGEVHDHEEELNGTQELIDLQDLGDNGAGNDSGETDSDLSSVSLNVYNNDSVCIDLHDTQLKLGGKSHVDRLARDKQFLSLSLVERKTNWHQFL